MKTVFKILAGVLLLIALPFLLIFGTVFLTYAVAILGTIIAAIGIIIVGFFPVIACGLALGFVLWLIVKAVD